MPGSSAEANAPLASDAEARAALQLHLRARGVRDLQVLRAIERVPRAAFLPHRYADLASRDIALPIGCGRTAPPPWLVARMAEALELRRSDRVLIVGAGCGYTVAVLSHLAGEVVATERHQTLTIEAVGRLQTAGLDNVAVVWADGLAPPAELGSFDRILVEGSLAAVPDSLCAAAAAAAVIVLGRPDSGAPGRQSLIALRREAGGPWQESLICGCRLPPALPGLARVL